LAISKTTDADAENNETQVWLLFSFECGYIAEKDLQKLKSKNEEIGRLLNQMIVNPEKY
jgi:four helix bundle protein